MMLWRRLPYLLPWRRRAAERDLQEELQSLRDMARPGELGNLTLAAEDARAEWGWTRLEHAMQDLRYAVRALRRSPGFATAAVLSLAIGIGANTALFTLINTLLWKLLPVQDPQRLLVLGQQSGPSIEHGFTYQQFALFREQVPTLRLAAYASVRVNANIDGQPEPTLDGQLVTGSYFPLLGIRPALGRLLGPDDDRVIMGHPVAVLSDRYWKTRFGGDSDVIGRQIRLSDVPFTIVGVSPPEFFGVEVGAAPQLFVPVTMQPAVMPMMVNLLERPNVFSTWLRVVGRLGADATLAQAAATLDGLARVPETDWRPRHKFTGEPEDVRLVLQPAATGLSDLRRRFSQPLFLLLGVSAIVLVIACANVASLLLARSTARREEFALRVALGAGRGRLLRQLLVEGLLLAAIAGAAGFALAIWATHALVAYASSGHEKVVLDLSPDPRVLAFSTLISLIAGLVFATVPAFRMARADRAWHIRPDLARVAARAPAPALVAAQVALSIVLLMGAGVFVGSLRNLTPDLLGVDPAHVLIVRVEPRGSADRSRPGSAARFHELYENLLVAVERIPGVQMASLARTTPLAPPSLGYWLVPAGGGSPRMVTSTIVYPDYFNTVGIPFIKGRDFNEADLKPGAPGAVIVNEAFVRQFLGDRDPVGSAHGVRQLRVISIDQKTGQPFGPSGPLEIIGVVKDSRFPALREPAAPVVYQTFLQASTGFAQMVLHVRAAGRVSDVARELRGAVQAVDPIVPIADVHTLADELDGALVRERLVATLSTAFAAVALVLVCVGLYGLLAFTVSRRTAEIGIRVALGATRADVSWMIARQALLVVLPGLATGLPLSWLAGRLLSRQLTSLLYHLTPTDPITMAAAAIVLSFVALCAAVLPARAAARIDPVAALRAE